MQKSLLLHAARRKRIRRIPAYAQLDDDTLLPLCFAKVGRALDCIEEHDPRRLRRLRADVRRILVSRYEGTHFLPALRMIVLYWPEIAAETPEQIALDLVHEATHARHHTRGIRYPPELRARIEAACLAQEAAFARRLPGGPSLIDPRMRSLERPWWTPEANLQRRLRVLRDLGLPAWLSRWVERAYRRRIARQNRKRSRSW